MELSTLAECLEEIRGIASENEVEKSVEGKDGHKIAPRLVQQLSHADFMYV